MPPSPANNSVDVVEIPSDDEEEIPASNQTTKYSGFPESKVPESSKIGISVDPNVAKQKLECRSFWKAGSYEVGPSSFVPVQGELEHARVHPKFLHSNATSHKWAFVL
ncbi:Protein MICRORCHIDIA 2 [Bienertia sinuspersici]